MTKLSAIINTLIKSTYYTLKCFILLSTLCNVILGIGFRVDFILVLSLFLYILNFILYDYYSQRYNAYIIDNKKYLLSMLAVSIAISIICCIGQAFRSYVFIFLYCVIICVVAQNNAMKVCNVKLEMLQVFGMTIIFASIFSLDNTIIAYGNKLIDYIFIYFLTAIVYLSGINFNNYFNNIQSVNKKRNFVIINSLLITLIIIFVFIKEKILELLMFITDKISFATDYMLDTIARAVNAFFDYILDLGFRQFLNEISNSNSGAVTEEAAKEAEAAEQIVQAEVSNIDINMLYNIVIIIFVVAILVIVYFKIRGSRFKKARKRADEKEFIFKKEDIINDVKDKFKKIFQKRKALPQDRLMYKNTVESLMEQGYEVYVFTTPNEYKNTIKSNDVDKYDFSTLTDKYNRCRYGKNEK